MERCLVFCAGEFDALLEPLSPTDLTIAADGGLRHLEAMGAAPRITLGDFDSLGRIPEGAQVFPVEKDDTDSMLAAREGLRLGAREFLFYGALDGPRLDHTLANLQTLLFLSRRGATAYLIGNRYILTAATAETMVFPKTAEGILSLFCLGEDARVSLRGLKYPLDRGVLTAHHPLGVSNHFVGSPAEITVHSGHIIALWDRKNTLPERKKAQP